MVHFTNICESFRKLRKLWDNQINRRDAMDPARQSRSRITTDYTDHTDTWIRNPWNPRNPWSNIARSLRAISTIAVQRAGGRLGFLRVHRVSAVDEPSSFGSGSAALCKVCHEAMHLGTRQCNHVVHYAVYYAGIICPCAFAHVKTARLPRVKSCDVLGADING